MHPHSAIRALVQCANDHQTNYPRGARIVKECFYVDDLLTGANTDQGVAEIRAEVTALLKLGGMNITKWKTTGTFDESIEFSEGEEQSVLGLCWNLATDKFFYKLRDHEADSVAWTKRKILSKIGKMYDPSGYIDLGRPSEHQINLSQQMAGNNRHHRYTTARLLRCLRKRLRGSGVHTSANRKPIPNRNRRFQIQSSTTEGVNHSKVGTMRSESTSKFDEGHETNFRI